MIEFSTESENCNNELNVTLFSNRFEFEISIGDHFYNSINLTKKQVSELIVALVEMHKEML